MRKACHSAAFLIYLISFSAHAEVIEIDGSPFATQGAPVPLQINNGEKTILIDPRNYVYGAYAANGELIRWGIATAGADRCVGSNESCRTRSGQFRIYSLGDNHCISKKYDGAPMPYCMFFTGGQALHGSSDVRFDNVSHGCVRLHVNDARWLRYHFVEAPGPKNQYRGTRVIVQVY